MQSDEQLYRSMKTGHRSAFEQLYRRYEGPLFGFILRKTANVQDAEEIFQDVMLAMMREQAADFQKGGLAAWLYRVATNKCLNRMRSARRGESAMRVVDFYDAESLSAVEQLMAHEQILDLNEAASRLTPTLRSVYELRSKGKSNDEAAMILAVPVGSVKSRIHAMIASLRREMKTWTAK